MEKKKNGLKSCEMSRVFFFFFFIGYLLVLHKQIQIKHSSLNQVLTYFVYCISLALQFLATFPMGVRLLYSHTARARLFKYQLVLCRFRSFIKPDTIIDVACYDRRLCDLSIWSLWPSVAIIMQGVHYTF